jgi:hypothetical protein
MHISHEVFSPPSCGFGTGMLASASEHIPPSPPPDELPDDPLDPPDEPPDEPPDDPPDEPPDELLESSPVVLSCATPVSGPGVVVPVDDDEEQPTPATLTPMPATARTTREKATLFMNAPISP